MQDSTLEKPNLKVIQDNTPSLRERQKLRRKTRIYNVAIHLFKERGFDKTTATDIAKAAHVSRGTFFNYYPYKESVLLDYGSSIVAGIQQRVAERKALGRTAFEILEGLWRDLAEIAGSERTLIPPLTYELINPDPIRAHTAYQAMPLAKILEVLLREIPNIRKDLSHERIAATMAYTFLMTALRWSAFTSERPIQDELHKAFKIITEGVFER